MAITVKGLAISQVLTKLGVDIDLQSFELTQVTTSVFPWVVKFKHQGSTAEVKVKASILKKLMAEGLDQIHVDTLRLLFEKALSSLQNSESDTPLTIKHAETIVTTFPGAPGENVFDVAKMVTANRMKLRDATKLYQPVCGTSGGSRYFLIAASADLKVAARYKSGPGDQSLSIRVEGPNISKHGATLKTFGFSNYPNASNYASMHLTVGDDMVAAKCLGAIVLGLGMQITTPLPDVKLIKNKGK